MAIPPDPIETRGTQRDFVQLVIHLSSGRDISLSYETTEEAEEVAKALAEELDSAGKPHWHLIDTTLVFTGAVSAFEVL